MIRIVEAHAPTAWERFLCGLYHAHERFKRDGYRFRRCLTRGCGMLCRRASFWTWLTVRFHHRAIASECSSPGGKRRAG